MTKKTKYLFCAIVVMLVSHAYINRSENIIRSNGNIQTMLVLSVVISFVLVIILVSFPGLIKKDGGGWGVVLIRINRRMILFSLTDYNIGFYMDI